MPTTELVVKILTERREGMTREEIFRALNATRPTLRSSVNSALRNLTDWGILRKRLGRDTGRVKLLVWEVI